MLSDAVRGSGCRMLHVRFNEMDGHGVGTLEFYKRIADKADLLIILECVFRRSRGWDHVEQVPVLAWSSLCVFALHDHLYACLHRRLSLCFRVFVFMYTCVCMVVSLCVCMVSLSVCCEATSMCVALVRFM